MTNFSCGVSEQTVTVFNDTDIDLTNITITSSGTSFHGSWQKRTKRIDLKIESLNSQEEVEVRFNGKMNNACISLRSDSLNHQIIDCMQDDLITEDRFTIVISNNSINLVR